MRNLLFAWAVLAAAGSVAGGAAAAGDGLPPPRAVVLRPRLGATNVAVRVDGAGVVRPSAFTGRRSLNGTWKFKGLDRRKGSFGRTTDAERALLSPATDDAAWADIAVPLNWWADARFAYDKVFDPAEGCFRGYYRRTLHLPDPHDGRRRFLRFEEIGAEAEIYVNGRLAGRHAGDFIPCEVEATPFLRAGDNLIALRVLADFGPPGRDGGAAFVRPYGARWDHTAVRGGLWHDVHLVETPPVRIVDVRLDPAEDFASVRVRGMVDNAGAEAECDLSAALVADVPDAPPGEPAARVRLVARRGRTDFDLTVSARGARAWSPDDPNLYWAAFVLTDARGAVVAAAQERFGFRTMRLAGGRFCLNGQPMYLVGDSLHSLRFGGWPGEVAADKVRRRLTAYKAMGANTLRTAHMPAIPEVCAFADEIGLMIYDEWATCFCNDIDEAAFEANNLPALEAFVRRDYNHASVVLWSLGNEVKHQAPAIARQLDRQYDLVKRLDGQRRPACTFSGVANVWDYGRDRLKTDFLDLHDYQGIDSVSWTEWFRHMGAAYAEIAAVYGADGALEMPLVMWECVGAGWGIRHDDALRAGDAARYAAWMRRRCSWKASDGIPFSAAAGLLPVLDRARGRHYVQGYLAARLGEMFRQDRRFAGFAPWFADPTVPGGTRWTQQVYPILRNNARDDGRLLFRQWGSSDARDVECAVVNDTARPLENVRVTVTLRQDGRETDLGACAFARLDGFADAARPLRLAVPPGLFGAAEVRLHLTAADGTDARNVYAVRLHPADGGAAADARAGSAAVATVGGDGFRWPDGGTVVVPPGAAYDGEAARAFVRGGGTLLVQEPPCGRLPGFPPLFVTPGTNHLVEPVVPAHPAFAGLAAADFDTWAENPFGAVVTRMVCPLDEGVLACRPRYIHGPVEYGMGLCEYAVGRGRLIVSTLEAERAAGRNPAAARYRRNLLAYAAAGRAAGRAPTLDDVVSRPAPDGLSRAPLVLLSADDAPLRLSFPVYGGESARAAFPACGDDGSASSERGRPSPPYLIVFFPERRAALANGGFRWFTLTFRSASADGMFDVTIPKADHHNRLAYTVQTALSRGAAVTLRLNLAKDFRFAEAGAFGLDDARGEIIFYNGHERAGTPPFPRPPVAADILEMRFE